MVLWPPDHKYVTLNISKIVISVTDKDARSIRGDCVSIQSVSCDEPANAQGDGNTLNDIVISNDAKSVSLRAERQGGGNGRVYTINLVVRDASGNIGQASYEVWAPQNQDDKNVIDDGPSYTVKASSFLSKQGSELSKQGSELAILSPEQPNEFKLYNNFPNPFNPSTEIKFGLVEESFVTLTVYDMLGRIVATLMRNQLSPGIYSTTFNAIGLSSGIYIYRLNAGTFVETKRMVLMK